MGNSSSHLSRVPIARFVPTSSSSATEHVAFYQRVVGRRLQLATLRIRRGKTRTLDATLLGCLSDCRSSCTWTQCHRVHICVPPVHSHENPEAAASWIRVAGALSGRAGGLFLSSSR